MRVICPVRSSLIRGMKSGKASWVCFANTYLERDAVCTFGCEKGKYIITIRFWYNFIPGLKTLTTLTSRYGVLGSFDRRLEQSALGTRRRSWSYHHLLLIILLNTPILLHITSVSGIKCGTLANLVGTNDFCPALFIAYEIESNSWILSFFFYKIM